MLFNKKIIILFLFVLGLNLSCSQKDMPMSTEISFSSKFIAGETQDGGVIVYLRENSTNQLIAFPALDATKNKTILHVPNGNWTVTALSWHNNSIRFMEGTVRCGSTSVEAIGIPIEVTVNLSMAECSNPMYAISAYRNSNQFAPLQVITCNPETALADINDNNCDDEVGSAKAFRVTLPGFYLFYFNELFSFSGALNDLPYTTTGLSSRCIQITDSKSTQLTNILVPVSTTDSTNIYMPYPVIISMYNTTTCSNAPYNTFDAPMGLNQYRSNPNFPGAHQHMVRSLSGAGQITAVFVKDDNIPIGDPVQLSFTGMAGGLPNTCLGPFVITSKDSNNKDSSVPSDTTVSLTYSPDADGTFYSDVGCTTSISSVTIPTGYSVANFYFKKASVATTTLTASTNGMTDATHTFYVTTGGTPIKLSLTGIPSTTINTCVAYNVATQDIFSDSANVVSDTDIVLTYSADVHDGTFYSDSGCSNPTTTVTVLNGNSSIPFYFKKGTAQNPMFLQVNSTGYSEGTFPVTVMPN